MRYGGSAEAVAEADPVDTGVGSAAFFFARHPVSDIDRPVPV
jgi:hypothetical protein